MRIEPIKTRILQPPKDDLLSVLNESLPKLEERSVVVVSSKVVAIWQGRCVPMPKTEPERSGLKDTLVKKESDWYLPRDRRYRFGRTFSIYEGVLGGSAGIDESNGDGYFILLPKDSEQAARTLQSHMRNQHGVRDIGVIVSDSRSVPMRNGTIAVALGHAGFDALYDYRGTKDVFGRTLQFERANVADTLATAANLVIGEGNECSPIAVCTDVPHVTFTDTPSHDFMLQPKVSMEDDVFAQFFEPHPWKKKDQL